MQHSTHHTTKNPRRFKQIMAHSIWITKAWDWFLELVGRAAEAILVISVLYSSVKLLPVVHMPAALDVVVFIAQFVALDVGGLSLGKLAKQAKAAHDEEGAKQAGHMSTALITIMIAGVVVVALEQLFPIPGNWKTGIDTVLLIARSILAVLYGHIIHSIKSEGDQAQPYDNFHSQPDSWPLVALAAWQHEQVAGMINDLQTQWETRFQDVMRHLDAEMRQHMRVSLVAETCQLETQKPVSPTGLPVSNHLVSLPGPRSPRQRTPSQETDVETTITTLLDQDKSYKVRELARLAGTSPATAGRIRKDYFVCLGQAVEADEETTESVS